MANVRCPMCSKINPPEAETCAYCGARLKVVRPQPDQPPVPDEGNSQAGESGEDWLSGLRLDNPEQAPAASKGPSPEEPAAEEGEMPDWLSRIRERAKLEQSDSSPIPESLDAEPDWMSDLRDDSDLPKSGMTGELLSRLPGAANEPQIDDWLQSYPDQTFASTPATPDQAQKDSSLPPDAPTTPDAQDAEGEEEWINKLSAWQTGSITAAQEQESLPDWMNDDLAAPASRVGENDFPDWLGNEEPKIGDQPGENPLVGWLRDVPSDAASANLPQWLGGAQEGEPELTAGSASEQTAASGQDADLPDWFSTFGSTDALNDQERAQPPAARKPGAEEDSLGDLPDWLAEQPDQPQEQESDLPQNDFTWLSKLGETEAVEPAQPESEAEEQPAEMPSGELFSAEESPDWLRDFSAQSAAAGDSVPALLNADDLAAIPSAEDVDRSFTGQDLPDWLSEETSTPTAGPAAEKASEVAGDELAQAELPEWVKEMRPIESVIPGEAVGPEISQQVEKAGPLAGLRGVLPAEEHVSRYRKPPVYSAKLRVTEKQRSQSSLLDSIVTQESQPLLIAPERSRAPRALARILVAMLLIAVIAGLRFFPLGIALSPVLKPPELLNMFTQIEKGSDSQNAPVLLAMDFEPGRAGEMFYASSPVIEHLMLKNARIVVLSTVPTGPALAQRLLQNAAANLEETTSQAYDLETQTINLGYLPGGTISLLEFAQLPSRAAPATLEGNFDIWDQSFLKDVKDLSGFSQVIVLTDSAETGRAWVEQVQPLMEKTPLFMITSAQAAPLLMPYIQSEQINGMVDGLLGGILYGQLRNVETPAGVYWESYQIVIVIAILLMLVGGAFSGIAALTRRKGKEGA